MNGLSRDESKEILLQTAICCGVPSANTAFMTAQQVFHSMDTTAFDAATRPNSIASAAVLSRHNGLNCYLVGTNRRKYED
ncbi:hypothetical protein AHiyo6_13440 [Arthrobacter sp. Hiyo6]|nr:hypothetical protein AHiyo6_13440 [Arthrobacter sp. Hiyo6]